MSTFVCLVNSFAKCWTKTWSNCWPPILSSVLLANGVNKPWRAATAVIEVEYSPISTTTTFGSSLPMISL